MYPQVFGKYILERELARGGMARVLLATLRGADGFEKRLVVKQIRDELAHDEVFVSRFVTEAKTTVALNHPNIVPVYELGVEQGTYYLSMELVEGVSLSELLAPSGGGRLGPEEGAYVGAEVCRALDYAHRKMAVVHRDVTPRNVMIDEEGQVRIIDFGIAARASDGSSQAFGTLGHMPPEQMEGRETSSAADIFAVATVLLEAWSGSPPYRRKERAEVEALLRAPPPKPSAIDIRLLPLDDVITRALAYDAAERPQQAEDLGRALRRFLGGLDGDEIARRLGERVRALRQRQRGAAAAAGAPGARERLSTKGSVTDLSTKTFAARAEVTRWISKPPPADIEGTRKLEDTGPVVDATPALTRPMNEAQGAEARGEVEVAHRETPGAAGGGEPANPVVTARPARRGPFDLRIAAAGVLALVFASALALGSRRANPPSAAAQPTSATTTGSTPSFPVGPAGPLERAAPAPPAPAPPVPAPSDTASAPREAPPAASAVPTPHASVTGGSSSAAPSIASTAARAADAARLSLLGARGTRVWIDGQARGPCPLRDVPLSAGAHELRFVFDPTGESKTERVTVRAGERLTVRADFTGTVPVVRIER